LAFPVLQRLFYILENYDVLAAGTAPTSADILVTSTFSSSSSSSSSSAPSYAECSAWALLMLRYVEPADTVSTSITCGGGSSSSGSGGGGHKSGLEEAIEIEGALFRIPVHFSMLNLNLFYMSSFLDAFICFILFLGSFVSFPYFVRLFQILSEIPDPVTQIRLFTEFSALLVHRCMYDEVDHQLNASEDWDKFSSSRSGYKFSPTLPSALLRSSTVRSLLEIGAQSERSDVLARFITALTSAYTHAIQYTVAPLLLLWPSVYASEEGSSTPPPPNASATCNSSSSAVAAAAVPDLLDMDNDDSTNHHNDNSSSGNSGTSSHASGLQSAEWLLALQPYLSGSKESEHAWDMSHSDLCTTGVRTICKDVHLLLAQKALMSNSGGTKEALEELAVALKAKYGRLMEVLVRLIEGSVFVVKTFER
jgi:hypothetical protein